MLISIITLFPSQIQNTLDTSILKRAQAKGLVKFEVIDLRKFGEGIHQQVDDRPYGGGAGMVLKADILAKAVQSIKSGQKPYIVLTSASGQIFNQSKAWGLASLKHLIIICGHYEGIDQRFIDKYVDMEYSIGDYVLTGGELPALVITDAITRLIPGVLNKEESAQEESFSEFKVDKDTLKLLEYPHYTRPEEFEGEKVPEVLRSGHHQEVRKWRLQKALEKTKKNRPEILKN